MKRNFEEALKYRRTHYSIGNNVDVNQSQIEEVLKQAILHVPSSFNSQSTRMVLLMGEHHKKLWEITKTILLERIGEERFAATKEKIDKSFLSGFGTILFFEDTAVIDHLKSDFAPYADKFDSWSEQTSGMHQLAVWTMLSDIGLGASLQHYNPLIDEDVAREWNVNPSWRLISQMPFGNITADTYGKEFSPVEERIQIHK